MSKLPHAHEPSTGFEYIRPEKAPSALAHYRITARLRLQMSELRKEVDTLRELVRSIIEDGAPERPV